MRHFSRIAALLALLAIGHAVPAAARDTLIFLEGTVSPGPTFYGNDTTGEFGTPGSLVGKSFSLVTRSGRSAGAARFRFRPGMAAGRPGPYCGVVRRWPGSTIPATKLSDFFTVLKTHRQRSVIKYMF